MPPFYSCLLPALPHPRLSAHIPHNMLFPYYILPIVLHITGKIIPRLQLPAGQPLRRQPPPRLAVSSLMSLLVLFCYPQPSSPRILAAGAELGFWTLPFYVCVVAARRIPRTTPSNHRPARLPLCIIGSLYVMYSNSSS